MANYNMELETTPSFVKIGKGRKSRDELASLLKLHGIALEEEVIANKQNLTRYAVTVSDVMATTVMEMRADAWVADHADKVKGRLQWRRITNPTMNSAVRKAVRLAIRAAYILQVKEALIYLNIGKGGTSTITEIYDRFPKNERFSMNERIPEVGALNLTRDEQQTKKKSAQGLNNNRPLIGMDPEFVLVNQQGKLVFADHYLQRQGTIGCDAVMVNGALRYALAELRPAPQLEPQQLVKQLHHSLQKASRKISDKKLKWLAGGLPVAGLPIGGHIHFSGLPLMGEMLRILDNYLALPFLMLEDQSSLKRRPKFGFLGDFREKPHGFEYRVLPSWIVSPRIAAGVLSNARLIADHYEQLRLRPLSDERMQRYYYEGNKEELIEVVQQIWDDLEQTPGYSNYREFLHPYKQLIFNRQSWDSRMDLRVAWKLNKPML